MAKAQITLPDGTKIHLEGTPEEIISVQGALSQNSTDKRFSKKTKSPKRSPVNNRKPSKEGPMSRIRDLISEDFFKEKRKMDEVKIILEQKAIFYQASDLAPTLIRLIKKGELRRIKENNKWVYVNV